MAFQNRETQYPNRKKMTVIEDYYEGDKRILKVDVERAEGMVEKEGTQLTADALNNEILLAVNNARQNMQTEGVTQRIYDCSNKTATTEFVWNVLMQLGFIKLVEKTANGSDEGSST